MTHFEQQSYYELLEVAVTASEEQILDAYARAMETYSPDSIAVYTLADPAQLDALRQRLTQAMETLSALDKRLEYDRSIGLKRSDEELARMRAESLKHVAEAKPAVVQAEPVVEVEVVVTEAEPVAEPKPAAEPKVATPVVPVEPEPAAAVEVPPMAAAPVPAPPPAAVATPVSSGPLRPAVHSRPTSLVSRPGSAVPPPLPARNGLRSPVRTAAEAARRSEAGVAAAPSAPEKDKGPLRPPAGQNLGEAPVLAEAAAIATAESALAQVSAVARDSRTRLKTVVDIPSDAAFSGELLRRIREGRNLSLQMLADRTRISSRHVENIEADNYPHLPAAVYLRGMLMSIARELGLDPLRVSRSYMELVAEGGNNRR
jgi:DNA-binding transcriptional regulator YiaG